MRVSSKIEVVAVSSSRSVGKMNFIVPSIQTLAEPLHHSLIQAPFKVVQANSWNYVLKFMQAQPAGYIVSIPKFTKAHEWDGCNYQVMNMCIQRYECACKHSVVDGKFCIPLVSERPNQSITWAHEKGQRLLVGNVLVDFRKGIQSIRFSSVDVLDDTQLLL